MQRRAVVDGTSAGYRTPRYLTFRQALELGGNVRKGEHGIKVYFVKQLQVQDKNAVNEAETGIVPMLREYTVFNIDQCENLPERITAPSVVKPRNKINVTRPLMSFSHAAVPVSGKGRAKRTMLRALTSSACRASKPSRVPRIFTMWLSTS